jgi:subtilase family serine protease
MTVQLGLTIDVCRHARSLSAATSHYPKGSEKLGQSVGAVLVGMLGFVLLVVPTIAQTKSSSSPAYPEIQIPNRFRIAVRSLITQRLDLSRTVPMQGAVHPEVAASRDLGPMDGSIMLEHLQLVLRRPSERQVAFDAFVDALHQPDSDVYHQWLAPEDVGEQFGPSSTDIESMRIYLQSEGFTLNRVSKSGMFLDFAGTASQVEKAFHTEIHNLITPDGRHRFSAVKGASMPESLAPLVVGFVSMSNIEPQPSGLSQDRAARAKPKDTVPSPCTSDPCNYYVGPQDFYTIYNELPIIAAGTSNGSGVTIALIEQSDITAADVTTFRSTFHVSPATPALTLLQGYTMQGSTTPWCTDPGKVLSTGQGTSNDEQEAVLDAEWAGAVAPGATLLMMSCAGNSMNSSTMPGVLLSAEAVIDENLASIMSLSYIVAEQSGSTFPATMSNWWEQAAAQGQTVVVCAGDTGSATNIPEHHQEIASNGMAVNAYASTAYNVAAGGTDFQDTYNQHQGDPSYGLSRYWNTKNAAGKSSARSYIPETTWNDSCASSLLAAFDNLSANQLCDTYPPSPPYDYINGGGSGGISMFNARPSWQNHTVYGLPETTDVGNYRLVPDISFYASYGSFSNHALLFYQSDVSTTILQPGGGTSFVAPQVAGIFALIEQKTGSRLGQPDYVLYSLAGDAYGTSTFSGTDCNGSGAASNIGATSSVPNGNCIFYDIVTGNNSQQCSGTLNCYSDSSSKNGILSTSTTMAQPAYSAGPGYDLATGIGSANIDNLVNAWPVPTFSLSVSPYSLSVAAGQASTATVTVAPGSGFSSQVTLACSGMPTSTGCSFSPASLTPHGAPMASVFHIATTKSSAGLQMPSKSSLRPMYVILFPGLTLVLGLAGRRNQGRFSLRLLSLLSILVAGSALSGCNPTGAISGTPPGTYTVIVSATSGGASPINQSTAITITITD